MPRATDPLSGYAVHFTRGALPDEVTALGPEPSAKPDRTAFYAWLRWQRARDETGYENSISILVSQEIWSARCTANIAADVPEVQGVVRGACLSTTRLNSLERLRETRSAYGVGFRLDVLDALGGKPVTYLSSASFQAKKLQAEVTALAASSPVDLANPFWLDARLVDLCDEQHDGRWEEEWRVPGGLKFDVKDVAFLLLPEHLHHQARSFFEAALYDNSGPAYLGPYLDSTWDETKLLEALTS